MEGSKSKTCCVTGAAGYIGSLLVKKLLEKGHVVHATIRNLGETSEVEHLKNLPGAESRLKLFSADMYGDIQDYAAAIDGCEFVFHVATPMFHNSQSSKYKDTTEAAVAAANGILEVCIGSQTTKRLIYTGSVVSASPFKDDASGFKDFIDESCWTPLHISYPYANELLEGYISSKTSSEKLLVKHNDMAAEENGGRELEVVSLACGLVGGEGAVPYVSSSTGIMLSPLMGGNENENQSYIGLLFLQGLIGSIPFVHIHDVCEAHIFCMERSAMSGRFLCASDYPSLKEIVDIYMTKYVGRPILEVEDEKLLKKVVCGSTKLEDLGFKYKHTSAEKIIDECVKCSTKFGAI